MIKFIEGVHNRMGMSCEIYSEANINGEWYCIDYLMKKPNGKICIIPIVQSGRSFYYECIDGINKKSLSFENLSKDLREYVVSENSFYELDINSIIDELLTCKYESRELMDNDSFNKLLEDKDTDIVKYELKDESGYVYCEWKANFGRLYYLNFLFTELKSHIYRYTGIGCHIELQDVRLICRIDN